MRRALTTLLSPSYEPVAVKPTIAVSPRVPDDTVAEHIAAGRLVSVLDEGSQTFSGYQLYYASRSSSPKLALVVEVLRQTQ
jgi:DNA-binding transcriptional LysR family regulator